jgi:hypothetical protein
MKSLFWSDPFQYHHPTITPEVEKLVILSVTSYLFNRRYGNIVDVTVGIPHVVPLETLRESAELKILLDLMFGEGWTIKADLRHHSSYSNPETDTLQTMRTMTTTAF